MTGLRKAALYLHGLDAADRHWLLDALSDAERARLQTTLDELKGMGVPSGGAWFPELAHLHSLDTRAAGDNDIAEALERIDRADIERVARVLAAEPGNLVTWVLKRKSWSWRQAYLGRQTPDRREALLRALETPTQALKPKVDEALLITLAVRLDSGDQDAPPDFEATLAAAARGTGGKGRRWSRLWRR